MMSRFFKPFHFITIISCFVLLCGCRSNTEKPDFDICLRSLTLTTTPDCNDDSAISVDLVVIYNINLFKKMMIQSAFEYYQSVQQIQRDFPKMLDVWHWELTPGQIMPDLEIKLTKEDPFGAVLFADYQSPGSHRLRMDDSESINILLKKNNFELIIKQK